MELLHFDVLVRAAEGPSVIWHKHLQQKYSAENALKMEVNYMVAIQLVQNLPLTSKQKFCFCLARPVQAKQEILF